MTVAVAQDATAAGSSKFAFLEDGYCISAKLYFANFAKSKFFEEIWKFCHQARYCHQQPYSLTFTPGALAAAFTNSAAGSSAPSEAFDGSIDLGSMDCAKIMEFVYVSRRKKKVSEAALIIQLNYTVPEYKIEKSGKKSWLDCVNSVLCNDITKVSSLDLPAVRQQFAFRCLFGHLNSRLKITNSRSPAGGNCGNIWMES